MRMRLISSVLLLALAALGVPPCAAMGDHDTAAVLDHCAPSHGGGPALAMMHSPQQGVPANCCVVSANSETRLPIVQAERTAAVTIPPPATLPPGTHADRPTLTGPASDSTPLHRSGPPLHLQLSVLRI